MEAEGLQLPQEIAEEIRALAAGAYPEECCGILIGVDELGMRRVTKLWPTGNGATAGERGRRFAISGEEMLRAGRTGDVVGFYHSHPDAAAKPSATDLEWAWAVYSYVIVSVLGGVSGEMTSWRLDEAAGGGARFVEEVVTVGGVGRTASSVIL